MIRLTREERGPCILRTGSEKRQRAEEIIKAIVAAGQPPSSKDFKALWAEPVVRRELSSMHNGRCCYCERLRDASRESDIEHFRPKTEVAEKSPMLPGYWWLAYEWANLFFSCKTCNQQYKRTHFPVRGTRARSPGDSLNSEEACLLDPAVDDIDGSVGFDWVAQDGGVLIYGVGENDERVMTTVKIIGLNRPALAKERWEALLPLKSIAKTMIRAQELGSPQPYTQRVAAQIRRMTSRKSLVPFVGMRRKYFQAVDLGDFVSTD